MADDTQFPCPAPLPRRGALYGTDVLSFPQSGDRVVARWVATHLCGADMARVHLPARTGNARLAATASAMAETTGSTQLSACGFGVLELLAAAKWHRPVPIMEKRRIF
jgi:hypothetical protein